MAAKKERTGSHEYIDANGEKARITLAVGARYSPQGAKAVVYNVPGAIVGTVATMLALRGVRTEMTNVAAKARADSGIGVPEVTALTERFAELRDGHWAELTERKGGAQIDADALLAAIAEVMKADGQEAKKIKATQAKVLDDEGAFTKEGRLFAQIPEVREAYDRIKGKVRPTLDMLKAS